MKRDVKVEDIARLAEITPEYVWKLRHGKVPNVSALILGRLAQALGVSTDYLLGAELDASGMPLPAPELREVVARVNAQPPAVRAKIARLVDTALGLLAPAATESGELDELVGALRRRFAPLSHHARHQEIRLLLAMVLGGPDAMPDDIDASDTPRVVGD